MSELPPQTASRQTLLRVPTQALDAIFRSGPLSRADLRRAIGISLSTVTSAVQDLVESGLVVETGHAHSTGGRPAGILDLAPNIGGVIALDIGGINIRVAAADCRSRIVFRETKPIQSPSVKRLRNMIVKLAGQAAAELNGPVRATAVSIAAIVDPQSGRISRVDNIPDWPDGDDLSWLDGHDAPLLVDNEANLGALGEHHAGAGAGVADMLFVALGAGIGAGLVLNNALYRGATGAAGEIGLLRWGDGPELERRAAASALVDAYASRDSREPLTPQQIFERAEAGERAARTAVETVVGDLAVGIANAIVVTNPTLVVIGGGLAAAGETLLTPLRERISALVPDMPRIEVGHLGGEAALVGAVGWATEAAQARMMLEFDGSIAHA